jgi:uncharacterized protein YndB with AHSA1/START domain
MPYRFSLSTTLPATPQAIYDAWLTSEGHAALTGAPAQVDGEVGGRFTAWGGYISGETLALEPGRRIVQSWRTQSFEEGHEDSQVEILLAPEGEGTRMTVNHSNVPDGQTQYEETGWREHYFEPMARHFGG